jgi:RNA polymerase sigma-70 factor (ECF subfamily)
MPSEPRPVQVAQASGPSLPNGGAVHPAPSDPAAFERLYSEHAAAVHRFCLSQVGDRALAEDLTHETFARAYAAYDRVHPEAEWALSWLLAIARNLSRDHHRARGRWRRVAEQLDSVGQPPQTVEEIAAVRCELRRALSAIAELGARDRELIGLRVAAGLSYREIGALLGQSADVAKVATFRALARLRKRLGVGATPRKSELEAEQ